MRWTVGLFVGLLMLAGPEAAGANERLFEQIQQVPQDVWNIATEPIKSVARETRRFDPITGIWFSLLEGSMKSVQRTAQIFWRAGPAAPSSHAPDWREARHSI